MLIISIFIIFCMIVVAGMISAIETAITATSPARIHKIKSSLKNNLLKILKIKEKVISTLLIGNSLMNTICTTIATSVFIKLYGDNGTIISAFVMSFVIIVFSEVLPKSIAVVNAEKISLFATPILPLLLNLSRPINFFLEKIINLFCFIFRIDLKEKMSATDEVRGVIEHHLKEGNVYKDDGDMMAGILDIRDMSVGKIMIHHSNIMSIDISLSIEEIIKNILKSSYSRIPFWKGDSNNIIGLLHIKDFLRKFNTKEDINHSTISSLLCNPVFIPETASLSKQLAVLKSGKRSHLAFVVDEYGGLQGIVTLEDILEEIVGQIYDEHDLRRSRIYEKSDSQYIVDGRIPIRDLNRKLNWNISEESTTIAGLVITKIGRIPVQGEYFIEKNIKVTVQKISNNRIEEVIIENNGDLTD